MSSSGLCFRIMLGAFFQTVLSHNEVLREGRGNFLFSFLDADVLIIPWEAAAQDPCAVLPDPVDADPGKEKSRKKVVKDGSRNHCGGLEPTMCST